MATDGPDPQAFTAGYEEDRDEAGTPRPGYAEALDALHGADLEALHVAVARRLAGAGVCFGADPFVVDPVPRIVAGAEWDALAAGLAQRARALNRFLLDAYGERRIVRAGVIDTVTIERSDGYEPDVLGRPPANGSPAAVIGFDLVRDPSGEFMVLEDNLRAPSGIAYAVAAREALDAVLPTGLPRPRPVDPVAFELLAGAIRAATPAGCDSDPTIVVLSDGTDNAAHFEHVRVAERLGATLAIPIDLVRSGDRLRLRDGRHVDVVYRRTNEDELRDVHHELTPIARLLLEPWLSGRIGLVNAFGNGLADDKFVHSHVEDLVRFYLEEEPRVRSVPTSEPEEGRRPSVGELRELVVKPRHGYGGTGVVIGAHAETADLERLGEELEAHPERYVTQPIIPLSRHPTVIDGELAPRHVDLRAFAFCGDGVALLPGGLTRVALEADTLVVNSSQHGGGKDTWVLD